MEEAVRHRILHVSENPADTQLLQAQLDLEVEGAELHRAADLEAIRALLDAHAFGLMVVDLPLPDVGLDTAVANLQIEHPELNVLFRWSAGGAWQYADGGDPLASIVRQTLHVEPRGRRAPGEGQRVLDRLVRGQEVLLRLAQTDFWDFEEGLRRTTSSVARLMGVERLSVWEFDEGHRHLRCLDLFELSRGRHSRPPELTEFPRYLAALESSLLVAANDARNDARTREFREHYLVPLGITSMLDAPIRSRGRVRGVVCLEHVGPMRVWDVLEQCHAASVANLLAHALEMRDRRRVEERLREVEHLSSIGRLAARLAQDFDHRLAVIGGEVELALADEPAHGKAWDVVSGEIAKATAIARNLMSLNRPRGTPPPPVDLVAIVAGLRPALERIAAPRITLEIDLPSAPLPVCVPPTEFEQVVLNLATNARDAMARGGVLRVSLAEVGDGAARVQLVVEDNGVGMDEETRARAFEPFFTTKEGASGFGLASVFAIVNQSEGAIVVESTVGQGTRVTVELPRA